MTKPNDVTALQTPTEAAMALLATATPGDKRFTPGTFLLNRYRVISLLGRGGMGEVYCADDMKVGRQVALKFRARWRRPTILSHLISEVRIGRDIAHPDVCRLHDIFRSAESAALLMGGGVRHRSATSDTSDR
jgi:hypothetical protein